MAQKYHILDISMPTENFTEKAWVMNRTNGGQRFVCFIRWNTPFLDSLQKAHEFLHWDRPFKAVRSGNFTTGDIVWFPEGGLNASYNCVDRWAFEHPNKVILPINLYSERYIMFIPDSHYLRRRRTERRSRNQ